MSGGPGLRRVPRTPASPYQGEITTMSAAASALRWYELPGDVRFSEGPQGTEILIEPADGGRWRWSVSQHTATAFVRLAAGSAGDCAAATAAGEAACRWHLVRTGGRG